MINININTIDQTTSHEPVLHGIKCHMPMSRGEREKILCDIEYLTKLSRSEPFCIHPSNY